MLVRVGDQSRELVHVGDQSRVLAIMHLDACLLAIRKGVGDQKWCWRSDQRCWRLEARDLLAIESEMCWRRRSLPLARARCTQPHPIVLQPTPTPTRRRPPRTRAAPLASRSAPSHLPSCRFRVAPPLVPPLEPPPLSRSHEHAAPNLTRSSSNPRPRAAAHRAPAAPHRLVAPRPSLA